MDNDNKVLTMWADLKALVEGIELDVNKNARGVAAAGVRTRKGLREIKTKAAELIKLTIELDKTKDSEKA